MGTVDELAQLYDAQHQPRGTAPRSRVRRENLRHGATGIVVRDRLGRVYVHRRTETKDLYPGMFDFTAGGVMLAGESPDESARREAAEELGVTGAELRRIGVAEYEDDHTHYVSFQYEAEYGGPIRWQPEEVAWGTWMTLEELSERLRDADWEFVPDSQAMIGPWLAERLADQVVIDHGWDSRVTIVEGRWIDREPRRDEVRDWLLAETRLLPALAPLLPLDVPVAEVMTENPLRLRHRIIDGSPLTNESTAADGAKLGAFLRSLHDASLDLTKATGVRDAEASAHHQDADHARFRDHVLPLLDTDRQQLAADLLDRVRDVPRTCIVHGDIGPSHVLHHNGAVSGVIDWADVHVGDPAIDLAWALNGTGSAFADALAKAYGVTADERTRSRDWYRLGPWHEVVYGLDNSRTDLIDSGMRGVADRL